MSSPSKFSPFHAISSTLTVGNLAGTVVQQTTTGLQISAGYRASAGICRFVRPEDQRVFTRGQFDLYSPYHRAAFDQLNPVTTGWFGRYTHQFTGTDAADILPFCSPALRRFLPSNNKARICADSPHIVHLVDYRRVRLSAVSDADRSTRTTDYRSLDKSMDLDL